MKFRSIIVAGIQVMKKDAHIKCSDNIFVKATSFILNFSFREG